MKQKRRGVRFVFDARAEVAPEGSPSKTLVARVTELSLNGSFIQTSAPFAVDALVLVKIFHDGAYFEAKARVIHANAPGMGLMFRDIKGYCQSVLQKWILQAMRRQASESGLP